ncbi:MAG: 23S rRNA (uracil(1939)-C(5))-methyltransferase RlmD [Gammaproteobacteria bacterium]|nr:23S rRNA (uracil(1939)-C(5))-methyltransferase RlmD [Gammaproteobacteria bacterium]
MSRRRHGRGKLPAEPVTLEIESLSHEGRGIAHLDGKVAFVDGALAGEQVSATYVRRRGKFDELKATLVLNPSEDRVTPPCEFAGLCGGCSLQHMDTDAQIEFKQSVLLEQMQHATGMALGDIELLPKLQDATQFYRRKARLAVRVVSKKGGGLVGFREKYSSFIADMDDCKVLVKEVAVLIRPLRDLITRLQGCLNIPQIEVAVGEELLNSEDAAVSTSAEPRLQVALVFRHLQPLSESDTQSLVHFAQEHSIQLYLQPGGNDTVHKLFPEDGIERLQYYLPEFDLQLKFHPMDFTQINAGINRKIVSQALSLLELSEDDTVLDLFCGLGNFSLAAARRVKKVVGVEGSQEMVVRGSENASLNGLSNIEFHAADLFKPIAEKDWAATEYSKIIIDPPRSGAIEIIPEIAKLGAKTIVYVSCNPATLARDTAELINAGYRLRATGVMDMFPHTTHVESMAVFDAGKRPRK